MQAVKVASRFLLPLEAFLGFVLITWAVHTSAGNGYITQLFVDAGEARSWTVIGLIAGMLQLGAAALEFLFGRHWPEFYARHLAPTIYRSVSIRIGAGLAAILAWSYAFKFVIDQQAASLLSLTLTAIGAILFTAWTIAENWRVRSAVDPRIPTYLHFHR